MTKVFICMPYGDHNPLTTRAGNTQAAMRVWHELADAGLQPFCPHLSHYLHEMQARPRRQWLNQAEAWLRECDAVLVIGDESPGMISETTIAFTFGIPIFRTVADVVKAYQMDVFADDPGMGGIEETT